MNQDINQCINKSNTRININIKIKEKIEKKLNSMIELIKLMDLREILYIRHMGIIRAENTTRPTL